MKIPTSARPEHACRKGGYTKYDTEAPWYHKGHIYATDGRIAVKIPVTDFKEDKSGPIRLDALQLMRKANKKVHHLIKLEKGIDIPLAKTCMEDHPFVQTHGMGSKKKTKHTFPEVEPLFKDASKNKIKVKFNIELLAKLAKSMGASSIELLIDEDGETPIMVKPVSLGYGDKSVLDAVGMIMPISDH